MALIYFAVRTSIAYSPRRANIAPGTTAAPASSAVATSRPFISYRFFDGISRDATKRRRFAPRFLAMTLLQDARDAAD